MISLLAPNVWYFLTIKNNQILGYTDNYIKVAVDSTDYKVNTVHEINLLSNEKQNVHGSLSIHA